MDARDSGSVFLPSLSEVCGRHCSPMVLWLPPSWYPRKGKYSLRRYRDVPQVNFLELRKAEVRRNPLPRRWNAHAPTRAGFAAS
jgi:hypothetical protein